MTDKIAQLVGVLGLNPNLASQKRDHPFHKMLREAFSQKYPSIIKPGAQGYEAISDGLNSRVSNALGRGNILVIGMLELLLEEEAVKAAAQGSAANQIGKVGLASVNGYLHKRGKSFRNPDQSPLEAAKAAFGEPERVPVEWLAIQQALDSVECNYLLTSWGIQCLGDLTRIPRSTLLLLTAWHEETSIDEKKLQSIQAVLKMMNLKLK